MEEYLHGPLTVALGPLNLLHVLLLDLFGERRPSHGSFASNITSTSQSNIPEKGLLKKRKLMQQTLEEEKREVGFMQ